jgi:hypothetical protein
VLEKYTATSYTNFMQIMPDVLARLFVVPPSSSTLNPAATACIGTLISARIAADVKSRLKEVHTEALKEIYAKMLKEIHMDTLDAALDLRNAADVEFYEELHDYKLDLTTAKEEGLTEMRHEFDSKLEELVETAAEIEAQTGAEMQEHADEVYHGVWEKLNRLVAMKEATQVQQMRKTLEREKKTLDEERHLYADIGQRATSLPL